MALGAHHVAQLRLRRALSSAYGTARRTRRKRMPEQRWPRAAHLAYFQQLKAVLRDLHGQLGKLLIPQLPRLLALVASGKPAVLRADGLRLDATDDLKAELARINDVADNVIGDKRAKDIAATAGQQVSSFNKGELNGQFKASLGIELLHGEPYLQQQLDLFAEDNARLITSLAADHLDQVAGIVMRGARAGTPVARVQQEIEDRFDVTQSKAEFLARDQVGKLNGELTQLRHSAVGVTEYEWSTSRDERVRSRHAELEGTTHNWDDPPVVDPKTGRRAHPGQDFQCRCTAVPKVDDILDALGAGPTPEEADASPRPSPPPRRTIPAFPPPAADLPPLAAPPAAPPPPPSSPSTPPTFTPSTRSRSSTSGPSSPLTPTGTPAPSDTPASTVSTAAERGKQAQSAEAARAAREAKATRGPSAAEQTAPAWMRQKVVQVSSDRDTDGSMGARRLTLETPGGQREVIWKTPGPEVDVTKGIQRGTYYQREVALHDLDRELGGKATVPSTVKREVGGSTGSMQEVVSGLHTYEIRTTLERLPLHELTAEPTVRRTFLLDVISANDDRHGSNALWRQLPNGRWEVSAVDHGLVFPEGEPRRFFFLLPNPSFQQAMLHLDEASIAELRALKLSRVAEILHEQSGITSRQVRETLARVRALQNDPGQLTRLSKRKLPSEALKEWLGRKPGRRKLSKDDMAEINELSKRPK